MWKIKKLKHEIKQLQSQKFYQKFVFGSRWLPRSEISARVGLGEIEEENLEGNKEENKREVEEKIDVKVIVLNGNEVEVQKEVKVKIGIEDVDIVVNIRIIKDVKIVDEGIENQEQLDIDDVEKNV